MIFSALKPTGKRTDFHQADVCERLIYLQCAHYRTVDIELEINYKRRFRMEAV